MNIGKNGYATPFLYSNAQFCIISNHFAFLPQSSSHDGQSCSHFKAWVLSKKGKATANIDFNPEDPPKAYNDPSIHSHVSEYTAMARQVHGTQFDPNKEHEREPDDTPSANRYTVPDGGSPGYFLFIHRSLIVTYFSFTL